MMANLLLGQQGVNHAHRFLEPLMAAAGEKNVAINTPFFRQSTGELPLFYGDRLKQLLAVGKFLALPPPTVHDWNVKG